MIARAFGILVLILSGTQVFAGTCDELADFASHGVLPELDQKRPECSTSRVLGGGQSQDCFWRFDLRSSVARAHYARLSGQLSNCAEGDVTASEKSVNHPDSFDQITGVLNGIELSLSLKDKGSLGLTLIVLRRALQ